jgi:hypothetical protein
MQAVFNVWITANQPVTRDLATIAPGVASAT